MMIIEESICEIFAQAWVSGQISWIHEYKLRTALSNNALDGEEKRVVNRLFYALRRGWLKVGA
ncbi:hypothetical protein [Phormidium sp. CCY1219]|uniref:hypothetical protein n=1 Tax=Phormidium sp. CCY1219 TaxID=2886104 RepID=UPI002D1E7204|nr:hypothetical protein [Phormidium sp. CCY1219]MEB3829559.1 hypothetical protein [Phormidium sp. CCY1219]